ncbi:hypothetical protein SAMN06265368_4054 [Cohaesibacter gelatinilyticus]|uniref:Uncharacterized protein n=1 Tax=Cohaesibacter gelatinilyticus TaxID=372072 RepID=A0A285PGT7_9HYPH|nr:hypothetical protein SAMN06265368_4054 [Cohaesibacter gelatinilyticus]
MYLLIEYQQEAPLILRGPAIFEGHHSGSIAPLWILLALVATTKRMAEIREPSPETPPHPPYRGVLRHTVLDFETVRIWKNRVTLWFGLGDGGRVFSLDLRGVRG